MNHPWATWRKWRFVSTFVYLGRFACRLQRPQQQGEGMSQASNHWGVEINGADQDKRVWRALLKPPFDPFVEEVKNDAGDYLVLRSTIFDGIASSGEVHNLAEQLFSTLNVAMSKNADTDPVTDGAVVDFSHGGQPRRHRYIKAEGTAMRIRGGMAELNLTDAQGKVVQPQSTPSRAQLWMRAATLNPEIGSALRYLEGKPGWFELYKAFEALDGLPNGGIAKKEISRFTQTANAGERHHPNARIRPHPKPMELWEARALITRWVSAAISDVLANNP